MLTLEFLEQSKCISDKSKNDKLPVYQWDLKKRKLKGTPVVEPFPHVGTHSSNFFSEAHPNFINPGINKVEY